MKLLLYGLSSVTNLIAKDIKKEHEIIGYMDSISQLDIYNGKPFYSLNQINSLDFDYLIITVSGKSCLKIYNELCNKYKINKNKIIPYRLYSESQLYKLKMENYPEDKCNGLIVGSSMSLFGILPTLLKGSFLNLSVKSQDIYHNYHTIIEIMKNFKNKLRELEYIIIDLYDYNALNYDISMTYGHLSYIAWGGMIKEHNFKHNKNFNQTFYNSLLSEKGMLSKKTTEIINVRDMIFYSEGLLGFWDRDKPYDRWNHIDKNEPGNMDKFIGSIVKKRFKNTISENTDILNETVNQIMDFNSNIKIIFTLIPRFITMEEVSVPFMREWKAEFEQTLFKLCMNKNVHFFDFKNEKKISANPQFFYDVDHLNTIGASCLTSILNEQLKQL